MQSFLSRNKINDKVIAVGVSGGADSLALVLQAKEELAVYGIKIVALTVNHLLRPSATQEAEYVAEIMQKFGIEHHILVWEGCKPTCGIEEAARLARYSLIKKWCEKNDVCSLMVAHHLRDQAETFLMRLQRGSGLDGLCCMREVSHWNGLNILRPFLHKNPADLEKYLSEKNVKWIHDESNDCEEYLRVRMRKFLPELMQKTGIDLEKFDEAISNLQSAESFVNSQVTQIRQSKIIDDFGVVQSFKYAEYLSWHKEIKFRILANLLRKDYIPRADSILQLITALNNLPFEGATLGGKEIILAYDKIWIVPELRAKGQETRKKWEKFLAQNIQFKNKKIPHKAKLAILLKNGVECENI